MSDTIDRYQDPSDAAIALFLTENDGDELTDVLVSALREAFLILLADVPNSRIH